MTSLLPPRVYQRTGIDAVREAWDLGVLNALLVYATGLGKTVTFAHLIRELLSEFGQDAVAMVIAHRTELLDQARDKYLAVDPDELVGVFQGARKDTWARVIAASIQSCYGDKHDSDGSLVRTGRTRQLPLDRVKLIVIDEAHHAVAQSYLDFIDEVRKHSPDVKILGVTATPYRADGQGLGKLWDCTLEALRSGDARAPVGALAHRVGILDGINMGFLVPFCQRSVRIELEVDLSSVRTSKATGDFVEHSLADVLDVPEVHTEIVKRWHKHVGDGTLDSPPGGRPTVAFCAGIDAAHHLAQAFVESGVPAAALSGKTPRDERRRIIKDYQEGALTVLCNCQVLTEGWDAPRTACVLVARPTKSLSMFVQMVGRGTRLLGGSIAESAANGKPDCFLLDFSGASSDGLVGMPDLEDSTRAPGIDPTREEEALAAMLAAPASELEQLALHGVDEARQRGRVRGVSEYAVDLFGNGRIAWANLHGTKIAQVTLGLACIIWPNKGGDGWTAIAIRSFHGRAEYRVLGSGSEADAMAAGSAFALLHGVPSYLTPGRWWTHKPATPKQARAILSSIIKNRELDTRLNLKPERRLDTSALPHHATGTTDFDSVSISFANTWLTYLYARAAFASGEAERKDELFTSEERAKAAQKLILGVRVGVGSGKTGRPAAAR